MSYYRVIDGIKYDRQLMEAAAKLTDGAGDGRISHDDAQKLLKIAEDGGQITQIERRTLDYLLESLNWTDKARDWFKESLQIEEEAPILSAEALRKILRLEFEVPNLSVTIDEKEAQAQQKISPKVDLEDAIREALLAFIFDDEHPESPRSLVREVHDLTPEKEGSKEEAAIALDNKVREYMNTGEMFLVPLKAPKNEDDIEVYPPEDGESLQENWAFMLRLSELSDHLFWAIVSRSGEQAAYSYGFN